MAVQGAQSPTFTLRRLCKQGQVRTYKYRGDLTINESELGYEGIVTEKVLAFGDKGFELEVGQTNAKMIIGGTETSSPDQPSQKLTFDPIGTLLTVNGPATGAATYRQNALLAQLIAPEHALAQGEHYTAKTKADAKKGLVEIKIEETVLGTETIGNTLTVKVKRVAVEASGDKPGKVDETLWLDVSDFSLVKSDSILSNLPLESSDAVLGGHMTQILVKA